MKQYGQVPHNFYFEEGIIARGERADKVDTREMGVSALYFLPLICCFLI